MLQTVNILITPIHRLLIFFIQTFTKGPLLLSFERELLSNKVRCSDGKIPNKTFSYTQGKLKCLIQHLLKFSSISPRMVLRVSSLQWTNIKTYSLNFLLPNLRQKPHKWWNPTPIWEQCLFLEANINFNLKGLDICCNPYYVNHVNHVEYPKYVPRR